MLSARVVMAMPMGPPFGGMTSNSAILHRSAIFSTDRAVLVDTTPPEGDYSRAQRVAHSARLFQRLIKAVRSHRAEVVFFSSSSFAGFYEKAIMALACQRLGVRTVVHLVGSFVDFHSASSPTSRRVIEWLLGRFDRVLVVSDSIRDYLGRAVPGADIRIVPNPVECDEFPVRAGGARTDSKVQILFAGAMVEGKGVLDLVAALQLLGPKSEDLRVVMIGDGPLLASCRAKVAAAGLDRNVELPGFVDEATKKQLFRTSDVFVLPSHFEAMPVSVLEASSTGLAVVATDVGAMRSAVDDGVSGLIVPPKDPEQLAEALARVIADPALRRTMGVHGASWVRARFDAPIVAGKLIDIFNELAR